MGRFNVVYHLLGLVKLLFYHIKKVVIFSFKNFIPMNIQKTLEKNNFLFTDEEAEKRLKTGDYKLLADYGKDKKFIVYKPYIPMFETPPIKN